MSQAARIEYGEGNANMVFLEYLTERGNDIRKLASDSRNQEWHYGYYKGLTFIAETYSLLKFPAKETVIRFIKDEKKKVTRDKKAETDKKIIRRCTGCLNCFNDVLKEVERLFSWALTITS